MKVRHHIRIESKCPVNGDADSYDCYVYANRVVLCEDVAMAVEAATTGAVFQEMLTQEMADALFATVKTVKTHMQGRVTTAVVCRPRTIPVPRELN
jgi:hypothetical protein